MEWYCAVWNSDKVNNEMGAQIVYEKICEGEPYLVSECEALNNFYEEITEKIFLAKVDKGDVYKRQAYISEALRKVGSVNLN